MTRSGKFPALQELAPWCSNHMSAEKTISCEKCVENLGQDGGLEIAVVTSLAVNRKG